MSGFAVDRGHERRMGDHVPARPADEHLAFVRLERRGLPCRRRAGGVITAAIKRYWPSTLPV